MRLIHKDINKDRSGQVTLLPENPEDMWHAYNLVRVGDRLRSTTLRKVTTENAAGTVSKRPQRRGECVRENGRAYHTIDLELQRKFTIVKDEWDSVSLDRVDEATDIARHADLSAIVMQEGLGHICLITSSMTLVRCRVEVNVPKKRKGFQSSQLDKAMQRFYEQLYQGLNKHINFGIVKCVILASPGFTKDDFYEYCFRQADNKVLIENKPKFVLVHSSSGHRQALKEVLEDPNIANKLADTRAALEVKALADFYSMLKSDPSRAFYGVKHVEMANENHAIEVLLISTVYFDRIKSKNGADLLKLVDSVRENAGQVRIFSSLHPSGEPQSTNRGVAAILRFPMHEPDDSDIDDDYGPTDGDGNGLDYPTNAAS
uniref:Protein pelota homolog n=1 Tax=Macrostomum lignano TaxID=282301 RepID=A0A1I8G904_9PLAT